jgi:hypothetical protein
LLLRNHTLLLGHHYGYHSLAQLSAEKVHQAKHLLLLRNHTLLLGHHYGYHSLAQLSAEKVHQAKHLLIMPMCPLTWPGGARAARFSVPFAGTHPGRLLSLLRMQHTVPRSRRQQPASIRLQHMMPRRRRQ